MAQPNDFQEASGRAGRTRTRLVVEGYSNLALIAILFTGVQAQLISVTNDDNNSALEIATNAVFFGGLMFSVFTAVLAVLSGRWFSILREDDSDYLSSRWLAQDCADLESTNKSNEPKPDLGKYIDFQMESLNSKLRQLLEQHEHEQQKQQEQKEQQEQKQQLQQREQRSKRETTSSTTQSPTAELASEKFISPSVFDIQCILKLLEREKYGKRAPGVGGSAPSRAAGSHTMEEGTANGESKDPNKWLKARESVLSFVLLSPLAVACPAFTLFCTGILMLTWNKQPRAVAIFTSASVLICLALSGGFFLQHRRKHVIRKLYLGRPSF